MLNTHKEDSPLVCTKEGYVWEDNGKTSLGYWNHEKLLGLGNVKIEYPKEDLFTKLYLTLKQ